MSLKRTAAHWGSYIVDETGPAPRLLPDPADPHPARIGAGWLDAMQNAQTRIARPSIRKGWLEARDRNRSGDAEFVELPWDEALDILAGELTRIKQTHGNEGIFAGSYGWASAGRFHHAQSQMRRFLNTIGGYVSSSETYSHAGAEVILPHIVGMSNAVFQDNMTSWPLIAEHCETLVAFGGMSKRPAQVSSAGITRHDLHDWLTQTAANGCHIVNVSPLRSDMDASLNAQWIAPRPGTDCALMLGLAHHLFATGNADRAFLARYTNGADVFEAYVTGTSDGQPKTPEWASEICDIPAQTIRDLAERIAGTKTMIALSWSMQRSDHGEVTLWAGLALACLLGQIGQPGLGFGFGYGSVETVGRPRKLINWPSLPQGTNPVRASIPVARVTEMLENPGGAYTYNGKTRAYPDAKMVWWSGGNPYHHHQDLARLDRAWRNPETVVVLDHSWTATARRGDIVLPTTCPLERDDIMLNRRDTSLIYMSAAMPVMGEARDDHAILSDLAAKMGTQEAFTEGRSVEEWQDYLWQRCQARATKLGFELPDFEGFRAEGRFDIPDDTEIRVQFAKLIGDPAANALHTASGKIELHSTVIEGMNIPDCPPSPQWQEPAEWLGSAKDGQLHLISGQPDTRLHGQNDSGTESRNSKIKGHEACYIHPRVAAAHGLEAGDIVLIENQRGGCLAGVTLAKDLRQDCIALATGAWLDLHQIDGKAVCVHGNPNMLTIDKGSTGLSQGNIAHTALVSIRKWDAPLPDVTAHQQPRIVPRG